MKAICIETKGKKRKELIREVFPQIQNSPNFTQSSKEIIQTHSHLNSEGRKKTKDGNIKDIILLNSNKRNKKSTSNLIQYSYTKIIWKLILMINISIQILSNRSLTQERFSNITLKIKGIGNKNIFSDNTEFSSIYYPREIYINGEKQIEIKTRYYFNLTENIVELIWNNIINSSQHMFSICSSITEIDFTNFDSSEITKMGCMFQDCSSLVSINLNNFNTSKVINFGMMFYGCSSLASLNLSSFETSNTEIMERMFYGCFSLTSLNLFNFNTSKIIVMYSLFQVVLHWFH